MPSQKKQAIASGDAFTRAFKFQRDKLAGRPTWWRRDLLDVLTERRNFKTDTYEGSYDSLWRAITDRGVNVGRRAVIEAVRALVELGIVVRDAAINAQGRRLRLILRTSVKQTTNALLERFRAIFGRRGDSRSDSTVQRRNGPDGDSTGDSHSREFLRNSVLSRPDEKKPENTGSGSSAAALAHRAILAQLRKTLPGALKLA